MNIIGLMGPKIISFLIILIPAYEMKYKLVLVFFWIVKLLVDYDVARPGHGGNVYKLTKKVDFEVGELIVACVQFIPAVVFSASTVVMKTWIPAIPGALATTINFVSILYCIKEVIVEGKHRRKRNANSNNKK